MKKFIAWLIGLALAAIICVGGLFLWQGYTRANELESQRPLQQLALEVQSRPDYVPYEEISPFLLEATVCVEDARYFMHDGLDYIGIARGILSQFIPLFGRSGGSSIQQQVVKNLYGMFNGGLDWKGTEIFLALRLEKLFSKEEILALYVNIINYGDGYTGIAQAASGYFQQVPLYLDTAESSILAGIPQSPANFQLSNHFEAAKKKQQVVLEAMVRNKEISQQQAEEIFSSPLWYLADGQWQEGVQMAWQN